MISIISVFWFIFIIYDQLTNNYNMKYNGYDTQYYYHKLFNNKNESNNIYLNYSLDNIIDYPPKFHHFEQLPIK